MEFCPVCTLRKALTGGVESGESSSSEAILQLTPEQPTQRLEHYELLKGEDGKPLELGRGAMGITYKAYDIDLQCPVALKVISERYLGDESARLRFLREARSAARLRHSNVASVLHLGRTGSSYFYAMEFVEGETLERLIKRSGRLEVKLALEIATQVVEGLAAIHKQKLVHRDIKPSNIMVSVEQGSSVTAKIIDLGLAKPAPDAPADAAISMPGAFAGTPEFASPEQFAGVGVDIRSDLYSLGATLWKMLIGHVVFSGSPAEVMYQHQHAPLPLKKLEAVPQPVVVLLEVLLEKDPARRFKNPTELLTAMPTITRGIDAGRAIDRHSLQQTPPAEANAVTRKPTAILGPEKISVARLPVTGSDVFGREEDLAFLNDAWASQHINVVTIVAWGGVGKSTLVNHWLRRMAAERYRSAQLVFGWSFYRQGTSGNTSSADEFLDAPLAWFGDPGPRIGTAWEKGERLAKLVAHHRTLLILDGLEPLQNPPGPQEGRVREPSLQALLRELAAFNTGLCVITKVWRSGGVRSSFEEVDSQAVSCLSHEALIEWHFGEIASSRVTIAEAISLAKELNDMHGLAVALFYAAVLGYFELNLAVVERLATDLIELSTRHNFGHWRATGAIYRGWARSASGNTAAGIAEIEEGIGDYRAMGSILFLPFFLALKAEALYLADRTSDALEAITKVEELIERFENRYWCAELHRLRGVFLTATGADEIQIEASFCEAIRIAREQKSTSLEKRAEATYAEYRRQKASASGGRGFRLPLG